MTNVDQSGASMVTPVPEEQRVPTRAATTRTGRTLPVAHFEEHELDHGCHLVYGEYGDHVRVAYDPRHLTADDARTLLGLYVEYREDTPVEVAR